jgi:hypothetical protein
MDNLWKTYHKECRYRRESTKESRNIEGKIATEITFEKIAPKKFVVSISGKPWF